MSHCSPERDLRDPYLERLRVPVLHLLHRRHLVKAIRQGLELLDAVGEADRELLGKEL
jgi:hypothetical protein